MSARQKPRTGEPPQNSKDQSIYVLGEDGTPIGLVPEDVYGEITGLKGLPLRLAYQRMREQFARVYPERLGQMKSPRTAAAARNLVRELADAKTFSDAPSPFNRSDLRDWVSNILWEPRRGWKRRHIVLIGNGPFRCDDLQRVLNNWGARALALFDILKLRGSEIESQTEPLFVLGRDGWQESTLLSLILRPEEWETAKKGSFYLRLENWSGLNYFARSESCEIPSFLSQELVLYYLFCQRNPLRVGSDFLDQHAENHPALTFLLCHQGFRWVSTEVYRSLGGEMSGNSWPQVGLLKYLGYTVGRAGLAPSTRRGILRQIYQRSDLPTVCSSDYMAKWGQARSAQRLRELAVTLASFTRLRKRQTADCSVAIFDYEDDLQWLKEEFYVGRYDHCFSWPR